MFLSLKCGDIRLTGHDSGDRDDPSEAEPLCRMLGTGVSLLFDWEILPVRGA